MQAQAPSPKVSVEQIVQRILTFRQITRLDQRLLKAVLLSETLISEAEHRQLNRVFDSLQRGLIKVVD